MTDDFPKAIRIRYKNRLGVESRFSSEDEMSLLQHKLWTFTEERLAALLREINQRPAKYRPSTRLLSPTPTFAEIAAFLTDVRLFVAGDVHVEEAVREDVPGERVLLTIFSSPPRAGSKAVERLVRALAGLDGHVNPYGLDLAAQWDRVTGRVRFPGDDELRSPAEERAEAQLRELVRAHRLEWDSEPEGSPRYRWPNLSLPDENPPLLHKALQLVREQANRPDAKPGLSEADIAYCLFSACKHGGSYVQWIPYCLDSRPAAGALIDFLGWREWVRPSLRAAWCLSQMAPALRAEAVTFARERYADVTDGLHEVLDAIESCTVVDLLIRLEAEKRAVGDVERADKHRMIIDEMQTPPHTRGARSAFQ